MAELRLGALNYVFLMGRAVREVELKYNPKGIPVCNMVVAVNRRYQLRDTSEWKEETNFFNVVVFGPAAERCAERIKKGSAVLIVGRLRSRSWITQEGAKRYVVEIVSNRIQILDKIGPEVEIEATPEPEVDEVPPQVDDIDDLPF
ncbi:MAG: single-stranded DNA-binding protein [candidate division WOR-3 bacterium]|nr:single-stranded DNA-binding protein [candidate division WOR-3 bacterium]MDW7987187.1 single-stranded DNA-binding protein [candidate division WOR-3 bacterium]